MKLGVVVGRFQVPDLHPAHHILLGKAIGENDKVLVVVGVTAGVPTNHDPMGFEPRRDMIKYHYPNVEVVPLKDRSSDRVWSRNLDEIVSVYAKENDQVTMYCGRDGFKSSYLGHHKVEQIDSIPEYSGTALRAEARLRPINSVEFRRGITYGVGNRYPNTFVTVDIAVLRKNGSVLMGRRPGATHFRFPGGFVDIKDSRFEETCKRELKEELGLEAVHERAFKYVATMPVDDWRYRGRPDARIMTVLFAIDENDTVGHPNPDQDEFEDHLFIALTSDGMSGVVAEHKPLFMELLRYLDGFAHGVSGKVQREQKVST